MNFISRIPLFRSSTFRSVVFLLLAAGGSVVRATETDSLRLLCVENLSPADSLACCERDGISRGVQGFTVGANGGFVLPHNDVVANLLSGRNYVTVAHAAWTWRASGTNPHEHDLMYGLPRFDVGLLVSDFSQAPLHRLPDTPTRPWNSPIFDAPSTMGQMITPYASVERPLARSRKVEFGYRMEQGLGISTNPYNKETNPENELIGGRCAIMVGLGFYLDYHVDPQWTIGITGGFHHYSNGRTDEPNIGVNPIDAGIRAVYTLNPDSTWRRPYDWFRLRSRGDVNYRKHFYVDVAASWLPRVMLCEWNYCWYTLDPSDPRYRTSRYPTHHNASASAALMYSYSPKYSSGIGLEFLYAPNAEDIHYWEALKGYPERELQSNHGVSLVVHHEARYKSLGVHLGLGVYLKREPQFFGDVDLPFYETVGVRYYPPFFDRRLFLSYNIRAHALTADAFQFSLGYSFGRR